MRNETKVGVEPMADMFTISLNVEGHCSPDEDLMVEDFFMIWL